MQKLLFLIAAVVLVATVHPLNQTYAQDCDPDAVRAYLDDASADLGALTDATTGTYDVLYRTAMELRRKYEDQTDVESCVERLRLLMIATMGNIQDHVFFATFYSLNLTSYEQSPEFGEIGERADRLTVDVEDESARLLEEYGK